MKIRNYENSAKYKVLDIITPKYGLWPPCPCSKMHCKFGYIVNHRVAGNSFSMYENLFSFRGLGWFIKWLVTLRRR